MAQIDYPIKQAEGEINYPIRQAEGEYAWLAL